MGRQAKIRRERRLTITPPPSFWERMEALFHLAGIVVARKRVRQMRRRARKIERLVGDELVFVMTRWMR